MAYRFVDKLPYTPMGKIFFRQLAKEPFVPENFIVTDFEYLPDLKPEK